MSEMPDVSDELDRIISDCQRFTSERLHGSTYELNHELGTAQYLLARYTSTNPHDNERIEAWGRQIEIIKKQGEAISSLSHPAEMERRQLARSMTAIFIEKNSKNAKTAIRYLLVACGAAMVASLSAIAQAWDERVLVIIIAKHIQYYFAPALFLAVTADAADSVLDSILLGDWSRLTDTNTTSTTPERGRRYQIFNSIRAITLGFSIAAFGWGIFSASNAIIKATETQELPATSVAKIEKHPAP